MRRLLAASFVAWCVGCEYDPACKSVLQHAPQLRERLTQVEKSMKRDEVKGSLTFTLTPAMAQRLLSEAEAIEAELPASARADDLNVLLVKLASRRSAFEQSLRDFLAVDPSQLDKGIDSGAIMPLRRGVEMSHNAMLQLADTALEVCRMHE